MAFGFHRVPTYNDTRFMILKRLGTILPNIKIDLFLYSHPEKDDRYIIETLAYVTLDGPTVTRMDIAYADMQPEYEEEYLSYIAHIHMITFGYRQQRYLTSGDQAS